MLIRALRACDSGIAKVWALPGYRIKVKRRDMVSNVVVFSQIHGRGRGVNGGM